MKINKFTLALCFLFITTALCSQENQRKADKATFQWEYDIECYGGTAKRGYRLVKVWSYSKEKSIAIEQAMKNAVHGIIFKGYSAQQKVCRESRPLMNKELTQQEYKAFFEDFFQDNGEFNRFVSTASDNAGTIEVQKLVKNKKGNKRDKFHKYRIGVVVTVASNELRKYLENKNIINSLSKGF